MSSHSYLGRFYIVSLIVGLIISYLPICFKIEIDGYRQKRVPQSQNSQDVIPHSMSWLAIVLIKEPTHLWSCSGSLISRPPHHHESRQNLMVLLAFLRFSYNSSKLSNLREQCIRFEICTFIRVVIQLDHRGYQFCSENTMLVDQKKVKKDLGSSM
uniref:ATP synthase F0 subunit 8 n=1 Tax=Romanomermis culicivorax TaxID=13658 RepID=A0A915KHA9_ROMCU